MSSHVRKTDEDPGAVTVALQGRSHRAPLFQNNREKERGCESYLGTVAIQHSLDGRGRQWGGGRAQGRQDSADAQGTVWWGVVRTGRDQTSAGPGDSEVLTLRVNLGFGWDPPFIPVLEPALSAGSAIGTHSPAFSQDSCFPGGIATIQVEVS